MKIFCIMIENYDLQLSFILKIEKTNLEKDKNPPNYSSPYFRFFTYMARLSKRAPFLLFSLKLTSNSLRVFFFISFLKEERELDEENFFPFLFALIFFLKEMKEGNRRRSWIDFHSFFLTFFERRMGEVVEKNSYIFLFFFFLREGKMGGFGSFFVLVSLFRICRGIDKRKNRIYNKIETS